MLTVASSGKKIYCLNKLNMNKEETLEQLGKRYH
jgi:hypothetical protein